VNLKKIKTKWTLLTIIAITSGIIYNSWPLGYLLNRPIAGSLASDLEGLHQPYNWVFIGGDIVSSVLIISVAVYVWHYHGQGQKWLKAALLNTILFGIGTIVDAALPLRCVSEGTTTCPNFTHDPLLFAHGICSIVASVCLFLAIFYLWRRNSTSILLRLTLLGYAVFALVSLIDVLIDSRSALSQHYYITLCGICLAVIPWAAEKGLVLVPIKARAKL
jgi:hypothetical protein